VLDVIEHLEGSGEATALIQSRAVLARFLAELFAEPDDEWRRRLNDDGTKREVLQALRCLGLPSHDGAFSSIPQTTEVLEERNRLFGHTVRSACPPYELEYGRGEVFQQSQSLADLAGFYAAFGYQSNGPLSERPDHLVAEWEFLSVLALKESIAQYAEQNESAQCCRDAQRLFLRDHAATWMPAFCARLRKSEPGPFFLAAVNLSEALLTSWCAALGVSTGPAWLELRPVEEEDTTISCGTDEETPRVELGPTLAAALGARS